MRPLETLIPILLAINILLPLIAGRRNPRLVTILPFLVLILAGVHLSVEGYRWQMIPLYMLTGILLLAAIPAFFRPATQAFKRLSWPGARLIGVLVLLAAATALPLLLPVPSIPAPGGSHQVGTQTWVLADDSRRELYSGVDEPRRFIVQLWYPAIPGPEDLQAPWMGGTTTYGHAISAYLVPQLP